MKTNLEIIQDLDRLRVLTLAKVARMLRGSDASKITSHGNNTLYGDVLMALGIEDLPHPDSMVEVILEMGGDSGHGVIDRALSCLPLSLDEYQNRTQDTAIYPGQGTPLGLIYCALKMNGEAGEFAEHVGKAIRDDGYCEPVDQRWGELTPDRHALLKKELGDIGWYLAAAARELGFTLSEVMQENLDKLADRKARGVLGGSGDVR